MRILTVADEESKLYYDFYRPGRLDGIDLIIACGDLSKSYLEFLVTMAHCPLVYVRGNHDDKLIDTPPEGCECIEDTLYTYKGVRIIGLGGSYKYRKTGSNMYTEKQMTRRIRRLRWKLKRAGGVDIVVTHAPIRGVNDFDSLSHRGFECFRELVERYSPKLFVHGHIHMSYGVNIPQLSDFNGTTVVNAYDHCVVDI